MNKKSTQMAVYIVVFFMMSTGIIYFVAVSQEVGEASGEVGPLEANENEAREIEEHEALQIGSAGVQFHLEVDEETIRLWLEKSKDEAESFLHRLE